MKKAKGNNKFESSRIRVKPWPIVTSEVCEKCPIRCPQGVAYMERMRSAGKLGRGVVCKKELFLKRQTEGRPLFKEELRLYSWTKKAHGAL